MKGEFKNLPSGWKVVKLGDVFEKSFYGTSKTTSINGKYPVLRMGNMQNGTLDLRDLVYIDLEENEFEKYRLHKGDILLNRTNSHSLVGKVSLFDLDGDYLTASYLVAFRPNLKVLNPTFSNNLLNTIRYQEKIRTIATKGVSQSNINPTSFKNIIKIPLPPLDEQEKIAEILSTWDEAINLTINLIESKKQFKKALMQNLLTAKIRFPQFKDEWKETKLGEICEIQTGKLNANAMIQGGRYKFFTCAKEVFEIDDYAFDTEAILVSGNGENVGYIHYFNGKFNAYQRTYVLDKFTENILFIKYFLEFALKRKIEIEKKDGNTPYIVLSTIFGFIVKLPNLKEQQKIAEVLTACDDEINLLNLKLENLKRQKQGLMQKLLSGKVRVRV
ncbi:restriction endonuclease subunit S [Campylobacter concisus]